mmetsp:Transcript_5355/g.21912  ORF Transcript_5355/g.21912 Transcript_5355/m.21912 type:complete len:209 (-) Transcript_5355:1861-2487(-)
MTRTRGGTTASEKTLPAVTPATPISSIKRRRRRCGSSPGTRRGGRSTPWSAAAAARWRRRASASASARSSSSSGSRGPTRRASSRITPAAVRCPAAAAASATWRGPGRVSSITRDRTGTSRTNRRSPSTTTSPRSDLDRRRRSTARRPRGRLRERVSLTFYLRTKILIDEFSREPKQSDGSRVSLVHAVTSRRLSSTHHASFSARTPR